MNLENHEFKRTIQIAKIKGLTRSKDNSGMLIIHINDEYDYIFDCKRREKLFTCLKQYYFKLTNKNIRIFEVKGAFRRSHTTKDDVRNGIERLPKD